MARRPLRRRRHRKFCIRSRLAKESSGDIKKMSLPKKERTRAEFSRLSERTSTMKIHEYQAKELAGGGRGIGAARHRRRQHRGGAARPSISSAARSCSRPRSTPAAGARAAFPAPAPTSAASSSSANATDCARVAEVMFKFPLVTKQTGPQGQKVSRLLVQEAADIAREIYVGMVLDRAIGMPVLMACAEGGVEIEEVAARNPEAILKEPVLSENGLRAVPDPQARLRPGLHRRAGAAGREGHGRPGARLPRQGLQPGRDQSADRYIPSPYPLAQWGQRKGEGGKYKCSTPR